MEVALRSKIVHSSCWSRSKTATSGVARIVGVVEACSSGVGQDNTGICTVRCSSGFVEAILRQ